MIKKIKNKKVRIYKKHFFLKLKALVLNVI